VIDQLADFYVNANRAYMALIMAASMAIMMRAMYLSGGQKEAPTGGTGLLLGSWGGNAMGRHSHRCSG